MSIKKKFTVGLLWGIVGSSANNLVSFLVFSIIARVVEQEALGVVAFAMIFIDMGRYVVHIGFPDVLIQRPDWDDKFGSVCFWTNIAAAVILTSLAAFVIAPIVDAHFAKGSGLVLTILSICYFIDASRTVHESKLRREFKYKNLAARSVAAGLISGVVGVTLALNGYGIWALVAQRLTASSMTTILTWIASGWRPSFYWTSKGMGTLLASGARYGAAGLIGGLNLKTADLVIGVILGPLAVATYRVGARGFEALSQLAITPLRSAALSAFSRIAAGDSNGIASAYLKATKFCALFACPVFFGSAAISEEFVWLVFGPKWQPSSYIMAVLALSVGPAVFSYLSQPAMTAAGESRQVLRANIAVLLSTVAFCLLFINWGLTAVAIGITARAHVAMFFNLALLKRVLGVSPKDAILSVAPAYLSCLAMFALILLAKYYLFQNMSIPLRAVSMVALGGILYPTILLIFSRKYVGSAITEIGDMFPTLAPVLGRVARIGGRNKS